MLSWDDEFVGIALGIGFGRRARSGSSPASEEVSGRCLGWAAREKRLAAASGAKVVGHRGLDPDDDSVGRGR